jgi:hypothetical protein
MTSQNQLEEYAVLFQWGEVLAENAKTSFKTSGGEELLEEAGDKYYKAIQLASLAISPLDGPIALVKDLFSWTKIASKQLDNKELVSHSYSYC